MKGIYKKASSVLEIYNDENELLLQEVIQEPNDYWVGTEINGKPVDFNIYGEENNYKLSLYPDVFVDERGFLNTNTFKSESVNLIII